MTVRTVRTVRNPRGWRYVRRTVELSTGRNHPQSCDRQSNKINASDDSDDSDGCFPTFAREIADDSLPDFPRTRKQD